MQKSLPGGRIVETMEIVGNLNVIITDSFHIVELYFSSIVNMDVTPL